MRLNNFLHFLSASITRVRRSILLSKTPESQTRGARPDRPEQAVGAYSANTSTVAAIARHLREFRPYFSTFPLKDQGNITRGPFPPIVRASCSVSIPPASGVGSRPSPHVAVLWRPFPRSAHARLESQPTRSNWPRFPRLYSEPGLDPAWYTDYLYHSIRAAVTLAVDHVNPPTSATRSFCRVFGRASAPAPSPTTRRSVFAGSTHISDQCRRAGSSGHRRRADRRSGPGTPPGLRTAPCSAAEWGWGCERRERRGPPTLTDRRPAPAP